MKIIIKMKPYNLRLVTGISLNTPKHAGCTLQVCLLKVRFKQVVRNWSKMYEHCSNCPWSVHFTCQCERRMQEAILACYSKKAGEEPWILSVTNFLILPATESSIEFRRGFSRWLETWDDILRGTILNSKDKSWTFWHLFASENAFLGEEILGELGNVLDQSQYEKNKKKKKRQM